MKNIAVIAGGNSSEYEVSMKSGVHIYNTLDETRFNKYLVELKGREWQVIIGDKKYPVDKNDFSFQADGQKVVFDFAYIAIHGNPGENGLLQGYLDMMNVPYSGCDTLSSALSFDKYSCNTYLKGYGIKVADSVLLKDASSYVEAEILDVVGLPCFVKPNAEGSSFGISRVNEAGDLREALHKAFCHCREVLVERFVSGRELTCGMLRIGETEINMPIAEVIPKNEFFDFEAKYDPTMAEEIIPAPIDEELAVRIKKLTSLIYDILRCEGIVRIDYIVSGDEGDEIFMLDVNTVPGMTSNSFVPKMVNAMNGSLRDILTGIIENGLKR